MSTLLVQSNPSPEAPVRPTREQCIQEAGAVLAFWSQQIVPAAPVQAEAA